MARKNPVTNRQAGDVPGMPGVTIPFPMGIQQHSQLGVEPMPDVDMTPNNGDQKDVATPPFAVGTDVRHFEKQGGADECPAKPGAGC